jgi:hypothetical protein
MKSGEMLYTPAMLARLTYSHAVYELSERLVSEASTYGDAYRRGALPAEEAAAIVSEAVALLEAAVVADRLRGVSWLAVADALEVPAEAAEMRFAATERRSRDALVFPRRYPENRGLGYTVAPYALEEPERVRNQLVGRAEPPQQRTRPRRAGTRDPRSGCYGGELDRLAHRPGARALGRADQARAAGRR